MTSLQSFSVTRSSVTKLYNMLAAMRPSGSQIEVDFLDDYVGPLGITWDKFGNGWKRIGDAPVAWSCHTDTVHRIPGYQIIAQEDNIIKLHKESKSNCLGADDTAGVWLMLEMIKAKRPGLYLFHRAEECGGHGSKFIASKTPELLKGVECVIALDRKANDSVITYQWGGRCCSDEFGLSLAKKLDLDFKLDKGGSFTDSASYTGIVGECTNVSVGYMYQHSQSEELDVVFLCKLRERLIEMDTRDLVFKRKPGEKEAYKYANGGNNKRGWYRRYDDDDEFGGDGPYYRVLPPTDKLSSNYVPPTFGGYFWKNASMVRCTLEVYAARCKELGIYEFASKNVIDMKRGECSVCGVLYLSSGGKCVGAPKEKYCGGEIKERQFKEETPNPGKDKGTAIVVSTTGGVALAGKHYHRMVKDAPVEYTMLDLVKEHPEEVAALMDDWGFDAKMLHEEVTNRVKEYNEQNKETPRSEPSALVFPN